MGIIPVKIPTILKKILPDFVWEFSTSEKVLYLTFDDGPTSEVTQWTLNTLKQFQAQATFFCIGNNIEKHPDIFHSILEEGHKIGNHSYSHLKGWRNTVDNYITDVNKAQAVINAEYNKPQNSAHKATGAKLFRPPYGQIKPSQGKALKKLGYTVVTWTILSFDWEHTINPEQCYQNVIKHSKPGSIIVFHDSVKASKNMMHALPKVLAYFSEKGYTFKTLPV
ncbi:polysaccharide deacetylase family protein [Bizionia sp. KMM 8389]